MKRSIPAAVALTAAVSLVLAACSGGDGEASEPTGGATGGTETTASAEPVDLTVSGWSLSTTPEFQVLADAFHEKYPNVTVELKEYDSANYNPLITADLAAGVAPDIITQKNVSYTPVFGSAGQLLDVTDLVSTLPEGTSGTASYEVDGVQYALPYRNDSWVIFYNKDLFALAGVAEPDGTWTWDDYADAATELKTALAAKGNPAFGTYQHGWQSVIQGFANAQAGDVLSGDYEYLKPYYQRALDLQSSGAQIDAATRTANNLTYQGQFGTQQAAMMPMGSWYVATLIAQQKSGDAQTFEWGFAPAPQYDSSTAGLDNIPVTFGDPTGFGINAAIDEKKVQAAKDFLVFASSEEAAKALAEIGITPALTTDTVADVYFAVDGAPADELSRFAWTKHKTIAENPTFKDIAALQTILGEAHTAIMTEATPLDDAIKTATDRINSEISLP